MYSVRAVDIFFKKSLTRRISGDINGYSYLSLSVQFCFTNLYLMFQIIKKMLGVGKSDAAALVREVVRGSEAQEVLFAPENATALQMYVECGHSFSPSSFLAFLEVAKRPLVKTYLEMGFELDDKEKHAVLELKDNELTQTMVDAGSWAPFPYGNCVNSPLKHHEADLHEHEMEAGGVVSA